MKIAISATGPDLNAEVDPRFGRCQYLIIADPETMQFEAIANESAMAAGGAGISAAQVIAGKGVTALLTGNCGPNAYQVLSPAGIKVITGVSGKIKDVIKDYRAGKLTASAQPNVPDHFGMGRGRGTGRGMGKGMGRGTGMGFGMTPPVNLAPQQQSPVQELGVLKAQSQALAEQLAEIQHRIKELEKKEKHSEG
jgi:predicted Fe-Mo cluster-binding NifX family protein